jgi:hypothetical protein
MPFPTQTTNMRLCHHRYWLPGARNPTNTLEAWMMALGLEHISTSVVCTLNSRVPNSEGIHRVFVLILESPPCPGKAACLSGVHNCHRRSIMIGRAIFCQERGTLHSHGGTAIQTCRIKQNQVEELHKYWKRTD